VTNRDVNFTGGGSSGGVVRPRSKSREKQSTVPGKKDEADRSFMNSVSKQPLSGPHHQQQSRIMMSDQGQGCASSQQTILPTTGVNGRYEHGKIKPLSHPSPTISTTVVRRSVDLEEGEEIE
jgi:hypothetical protein